MADKGVMVFCEVAEGALAAIATEGLGIGRKLADELGVELSGVVVGSGVSGLAQGAISFGADKVYVVESDLLKDYTNDGFVAAMEKVAGEAAPQIIIVGHSAVGRDLTPRLGFRLGSAATLDCIELGLDPASKRLVQTKPVYGGNARAVFTTDTDPQVVSIRTKAMTPLVADAGRKGEVVSVDAGLDAAAIKTKVVGKVKEEIEGIKLEDAEVVVTGGRGMGSAEAFEELSALAKAMKGALGASRPPVDNGWVPEVIQVGLTGKIVAPELYIAVALSGSSQHMSGCSGSKTIVAINKDPEANIFNEAQYGVIGDWKKVLPAFTAKVKELLAG